MSITIRQGRSLAVFTLTALLAGGCAATRNAAHGTEKATETAGRKINDASIPFAVRNEIENEPATKTSKIDVTTKDGVVTLEGTVPNHAAKKEAERIAGRAEGVERVVNHLEVKTKP